MPAMLIPCKNPDLYRRWLAYFQHDTRPGYVLRTEAFFRSERGEAPPAH
jgi:hypothetical protein